VQRVGRDDGLMADDRDRAPEPSSTLLDEAIVIAARRTKTAQQAVAEDLADDERPREDLTDAVVKRAVDLDLLAHQAADEREKPREGGR
jgi:hypothetical protein